MASDQCCGKKVWEPDPRARATTLGQEPGVGGGVGDAEESVGGRAWSPAPQWVGGGGDSSGDAVREAGSRFTAAQAATRRAVCCCTSPAPPFCNLLRGAGHRKASPWVRVLLGAFQIACAHFRGRPRGAVLSMYCHCLFISTSAPRRLL